MKLITELTESVQTLVEEVIVEGAAPKKKWFIEGVWLQGNLKNRNGRIYPVSILEREVDRYNRDYISKNRAVGELGHPEGPSINPDRISHKIIEMKRDGDNFIGKAEILNNHHGREVQSLLEGGIQLGVSSRGMGSIKENRQGIMEVQEDFYLATAGDIVLDPSAPDAFVDGIMEGVEWTYAADGTLRKEMIVNDIQEEIEEAVRHKTLSEGRVLQLFAKYLKSL